MTEVVVEIGEAGYAPRSQQTQLLQAGGWIQASQWAEFLSKKADEIRDGKKSKTNDPALSPAPFGRARIWQLRNGKSWPMTQDEVKAPPQK